MISTAAAALTSLIPQPNENGRRTSNNYFGTGNLAFTRDNIDLKVNYNPTRNFRSSRAIASRRAITSIRKCLDAAGGPTADGGQPGNATGLIQTVSLGGTYVD